MTPREAIALLDHPALRAFTAGGGNPTHGGNPTVIDPTGNVDPTPGAPQHWADLGCGSGTFTLALAHFLPSGSTIEAIDLHPDLRKQTTSGVTINPREADFTSPNLALQNLDGLIMANSLHYVRDQRAFLQTLVATLRPGGALLLVEYDTDTPVARWVPYPLSFATAAGLFTAPHWQPLRQLHHRPSAFGRSNLYSAFTNTSVSRLIHVS